MAQQESHVLVDEIIRLQHLLRDYGINPAPPTDINMDIVLEMYSSLRIEDLRKACYDLSIAPHDSKNTILKAISEKYKKYAKAGYETDFGRKRTTVKVEPVDTEKLIHYKKAYLVSLAKERGIETKGMSKADIIAKLV